MSDFEPAAGPGGDPACWLHRVCRNCGALADEEHPTVCQRCGATEFGE